MAVEFLRFPTPPAEDTATSFVEVVRRRLEPGEKWAVGGKAGADDGDAEVDITPDRTSGGGDWFHQKVQVSGENQEQLIV